jgi:ELWxxDGT repeat protein
MKNQSTPYSILYKKRRFLKWIQHRKIMLPFCFSLMIKISFSQITLVEDLYPYASDQSSNPANLVQVSGKLFFAATGSKGKELYTSEGTSASTELFNLVEGSTGSSVSEITAGNGLAFFVANTNTAGRELWVSDGTDAGTKYFDLFPGAGSSNPHSLTFINGRLYFSADGSIQGQELWTSDGTTAGTYQIMDIRTGSYGSDPYSFIKYAATTFFFSATTDQNGRELYISDGTASGTHLVKDITGNNSSGLGSSHKAGDQMIVYKNYLYFQGWDQQHGWELWRTDGTEQGTTFLFDFDPDNNQSGYPENMVIFNSLLFLTATANGTGKELYRSDGTYPGTVLVKDIYPGNSNGTSMFGISVANSTGIYFQGNDGIHGEELWHSDGTSNGTYMIKDIYPGSQGSVPTDLAVINDLVYFSAAGSNVFNAWRTDGTGPGTKLIIESDGDIPLSDGWFTKLGNAVYYSGNTQFGYELMKINNSGKSSMVKDINDPAGSSNPNSLVVLNDKLFFSATPYKSSAVDFAMDNSENIDQLTTTLASAIYKGAKLGDDFVIAYNLEGKGTEPCITNGNTVTLLKDIVPGPAQEIRNAFILQAPRSFSLHIQGLRINCMSPMARQAERSW